MITSLSLMPPGKKRLKIPILFAYWVKNLTKSSQFLSRFFACFSLAKGKHSIWNTCPHNYHLVAYATPKKVAENPDFIRPLGQSPTKLAIIDAVAIWLVICVIGRTT